MVRQTSHTQGGHLIVFRVVGQDVASECSVGNKTLINGYPNANLVRNSQRVRLQPRVRHFIFVRCAMLGYNRVTRLAQVSYIHRRWPHTPCCHTRLCR